MDKFINSFIVAFAMFCVILSLTRNTHAQSYWHSTVKPTTTRLGYGSYDVVNPCVVVETPPLKWTEQNIPNPQVDTCKCGRKGKPSYVCDPNNLMTFEEGNRVEEAIEKLRRTPGQCQCGSKKCANVPSSYGGYQASAIVLSALYVKAGDSAKETADDVTDHLRDDVWEFGACNDDLVILISDQDRVVYTATGELTRQTLNDKCVNDIIQNNKEDLSAKRYGEALVGIMEEYAKALQREHPCNKPMSTTTIAVILGCIGAGIAGCLGCTFLRRKFGICKGGGGGGGGGGPHFIPARRGSHDSHKSNHSAKSASSGGGGDTF